LDSVSLRTAYGGEGLLEAEVLERMQVGHGGVNPPPRVLVGEDVSVPSRPRRGDRGITVSSTDPPLASMTIRTLGWRTSRPPSPVELSASPVSGGSLPERKGLGGWLDEPLLLGQDELVRLGDVEPVFHPLMHDDDLAPAVEEISALDARGRRERSTFP